MAGSPDNNITPQTSKKQQQSKENVLSALTNITKSLESIILRLDIG